MPLGAACGHVRKVEAGTLASGSLSSTMGRGVELRADHLDPGSGGGGEDPVEDSKAVHIATEGWMREKRRR